METGWRPRLARRRCGRLHGLRAVISWDVRPQWQIEADPAKTSEVEVRFVSETPSRTRVELEHHNLERHGEGWEQMRDAVGAPDGWDLGLRRFAERLTR